MLTIVAGWDAREVVGFEVAKSSAWRRTSVALESAR